MDRLMKSRMISSEDGGSGNLPVKLYMEINRLTVIPYMEVTVSLFCLMWHCLVHLRVMYAFGKYVKRLIDTNV